MLNVSLVYLLSFEFVLFLVESFDLRLYVGIVLVLGSGDGLDKRLAL